MVIFQQVLGLQACTDIAGFGGFDFPPNIPTLRLVASANIKPVARGWRNG